MVSMVYFFNIASLISGLLLLYITVF